jgi:hypothetical protein
MTEASKECKYLSLQEKQIFLGCYDKLFKMSQRSSAVCLKILQLVLHKILKSRSVIETSALTYENTDRKSSR